MYTKIDALVWTDTKFKQLSTDGKLLFIYMLSCSHRNMLGLYHLPIPYGSFDMGWSEKEFSKGLDELLEKGLINYNFDNNIVLIPNYLKYNPLENQNQVKGAMKALDTIPTNGLDAELISTLKGLNKPFTKPLIELLDKRLAQPVTVTVKEEVKATVEEGESIPSQIKDLRGRYSKEELSIIDEYLDILRWTRTTGKIADSVILKIYQKWSEYSIPKVIYGLKTYIKNPKHHDKRENYCYGIIRNATAEEVEKEIWTKDKPLPDDDNYFLNRG